MSNERVVDLFELGEFSVPTRFLDRSIIVLTDWVPGGAKAKSTVTVSRHAIPVGVPVATVVAALFVQSIPAQSSIKLTTLETITEMLVAGRPAFQRSVRVENSNTDPLEQTQIALSVGHELIVIVYSTSAPRSADQVEEFNRIVASIRLETPSQPKAERNA